MFHKLKETVCPPGSKKREGKEREGKGRRRKERKKIIVKVT